MKKVILKEHINTNTIMYNEVPYNGLILAKRHNVIVGIVKYTKIGFTILYNSLKELEEDNSLSFSSDLYNLIHSNSNLEFIVNDKKIVLKPGNNSTISIDKLKDTDNIFVVKNNKIIGIVYNYGTFYKVIFCNRIIGKNQFKEGYDSVKDLILGYSKHGYEFVINIEV